MDQFSYYMIRIRQPSADDRPARPLAGVVEWLGPGEKQDFAGGEELLRLLSGWVERPPNMRTFTEGGKA